MIDRRIRDPLMFCKRALMLLLASLSDLVARTLSSFPLSLGYASIPSYL